MSRDDHTRPPLRLIDPGTIEIEAVGAEEDAEDFEVISEVVTVLRDALAAAEAGLVEKIVLVHAHQVDPCFAGDWNRREVLGYLEEAKLWAMEQMIRVDFEIGDDEEPA